MKKKLISIITVIFVLGLMNSNSFAEKGHHETGHHEKGHHEKGHHGKRQHDYGKMSMSKKFFMITMMIYKNKEEIGLTEDQRKQIESLKMELRKDNIKKKAELEILKIDIGSLMHKDQIDVAAVNKLIDQKYEIKKAKTKKGVESFVKLKKIITKDQMTKLKNLKKGKRKSHGSNGYRQGAHGDSHKGSH